MNAYDQSSDAYLAQRVLSAGPEQQAALLMEAGQRFLGKAIKAMERKDHREASSCLSRVTEIINEADLRLNREAGGELVGNLMRIYDWWIQEVCAAATSADTQRLREVSRHMGEIRQAWEQLYQKQVRAVHASGYEYQVGDRVV